jgi:hypothetical protein
VSIGRHWQSAVLARGTAEWTQLPRKEGTVKQGFCRTLSKLATLSIALGTASLATADGAAVIHACVNASSGVMQLVGAEEGCKKHWVKVSWNVAGRSGPQGQPGPTGPTGPQGSDGVCVDCTTFTPPTIAHDAPATSSEFELDITFDISDEEELAYYTIQGDSSPFVQLTSYFEPGVSSANVVHTLGLHSGINEFLVTAVDTEGNAGKALIVIEHVVGD